MNEQFVPFGFTLVSEAERESLLRNSHNKGGFKFFGGEKIVFGKLVFYKPVLDENGQQRVRNGKPLTSVAIQAEVDGREVALSMSTFATFPKGLEGIDQYPFMKKLVQCASDFERYELLEGKTFTVSIFRGQGIDWLKSTEKERVYTDRDFPMLKEA